MAARCQALGDEGAFHPSDSQAGVRKDGLSRTKAREERELRGVRREGRGRPPWLKGMVCSGPLSMPAGARSRDCRSSQGRQSPPLPPKVAASLAPTWSCAP